jgi:hypothetical protein
MRVRRSAASLCAEQPVGSSSMSGCWHPSMMMTVDCAGSHGSSPVVRRSVQKMRALRGGLLEGLTGPGIALGWGCLWVALGWHWLEDY